MDLSQDSLSDDDDDSPVSSITWALSPKQDQYLLNSRTNLGRFLWQDVNKNGLVWKLMAHKGAVSQNRWSSVTEINLMR